ncbi:MAG TPA: hypothetical protein VFN09_14765 [Rhodanobacteraceae bacterium]|nr:hypothetical protein [Rhodanobacteraceae bacterium]
MRKFLLIPLSALALAACSQPPAPQAATPAAASTALSPANPLKPLLDDRDKAKAVGQQLEDADQARRKAIEAAGG